MQIAEAHWLDRYAKGFHQWKAFDQDGGTIFVRPLGLVETAFHYDGTRFEGRADVNFTPTCEIHTTLSRHEIRDHIIQAWAVLRAEHALLRAQTQDTWPSTQHAEADLEGPFFVLHVPDSVEMLMDEARQTICFVDDFYDHVDPELFARHAMNTARCIDPASAPARAYILPLEASGAPGRYMLRTLIVGAHDIMDGMTTYAWAWHFFKLLDSDGKTLRATLIRSLDPKRIWQGLPPAQEDLYPPILGSVARQRWFWAISRVLRHIRRPPGPAFANPLRRDECLKRAERMEPFFEHVLDYSKTPPLNSYVHKLKLSPAATEALQRLCRQAGASFGAGAFTIIAIAMMETYEERFPDVPLSERNAFVASFPLNPRPFLKLTGPPESLVLAFSDGITFPFLPSDLSMEGRFRLLAKTAHRQLGIYQKRRLPPIEAQLGSRSTSQMFPMLYSTFLERVEDLQPPMNRALFNPQGTYPVRLGTQRATCGVSNIGSQAGFDEAIPECSGNAVFRVSPRDMGAKVRVRDDEFLCGTASGSDGFWISVSFDGNAIDEERVKRWSKKVQNLLEAKPQTSRL